MDDTGGHTSPRTGRNDRPSPHLVDALLDVARSTAEDQPSDVLEAMAHAVLATGGFRTVVANVFRPAWDDYEAVLVMGSQASAETLMGSRAPRDVIDRLVSTGQELLPGVFLITEVTPVYDELERTFIPDIPAVDAPDAWQPTDALVVVLRDADGQPLGFVSVDEPTQGRRPGRSDVRLLRAVCTYAEQTLRAAQRTARAEEDKRLLERLSSLSPLMSRCQSLDELTVLVTMVVVSDLGFERAALYLSDGQPELTLRQSRGWVDADAVRPSITAPAAEGLIADGQARAGCVLVSRAAVDLSPIATSQRNGHGALAWSDHALLVPWLGQDQLSGLLVLEDPVDSLLPSDERCRAIRLLVDLAAAVARGVSQQERLAQQARFDPLTGLRNRRGLHALIDDLPQLGLVCDLDHFKQVNDVHGHATGDHVLRAFATLLREVGATAEGTAIRLGGEEFCLILPGAGREQSLAVAERIRTQSRARTSPLVSDGVTVSVGVALSEGAISPRALLATADRGLYRAKQDGRDRVVVADP